MVGKIPWLLSYTLIKIELYARSRIISSLKLQFDIKVFCFVLVSEGLVWYFEQKYV